MAVSCVTDAAVSREQLDIPFKFYGVKEIALNRVTFASL